MLYSNNKIKFQRQLNVSKHLWIPQQRLLLALGFKWRTANKLEVKWVNKQRLDYRNTKLEYNCFRHILFIKGQTYIQENMSIQELSKVIMVSVQISSLFCNGVPRLNHKVSSVRHCTPHFVSLQLQASANWRISAITTRTVEVETWNEWLNMKSQTRNLSQLLISPVEKLVLKTNKKNPRTT